MRWILRILLVAAAVVIAAVVAVNLRLFVWPSTDEPTAADAVVVLGGGGGERLDRGLELAQAGVAPTLALSFGPDRLCNGSAPYDVVCFRPSPATTRGEARAIGELARARGWHNVVLVTSTSHVTRARLLLERCYSGTLQVTDATPRSDVPGWFAAMAHEWGGLAEATLHRDC